MIILIIIIIIKPETLTPWTALLLGFLVDVARSLLFGWFLATTLARGSRTFIRSAKGQRCVQQKMMIALMSGLMFTQPAASNLLHLVCI